MQTSRVPAWLSQLPIAHRGLHSAIMPENSLGAYQDAIKLGYGIEFDLHLTKDAHLVVMHDHDTNRMTGVYKDIQTATLAELQLLHLNETDYTLPTFTEVLQLVNAQVPLLIEIKTGLNPRTIATAFIAELADYAGPFVVLSFDPWILKWLRRLRPEIIRGQLCSNFKREKMPAIQKMVLRSMILNVQTKPDFLAFDIRSLPDSSLNFWEKRLKVPLMLWPIQTAEQLAYAKKLSANVIFEYVRPAVVNQSASK